jgi:glycosyltransferase involved in cell wall biosynthesis
MSVPQQQFKNVMYLSDTSGTGFWRHIQQIMAVNCIAQGTGIYNTYSQIPVLDKDYYKGITSISVQRWISTEQKKVFLNFFKPICEMNNAFLMYHIDDDMWYKHIPIYNRGREAFEGEEIQNNIREMLNAADFVVVTTDRIKELYHTIYGVPNENIIAIPNLLPKWWFGDRYNLEEKLNQFNKYKKKPRIGVVSSLSHYNIDGVRVDKDGKACRCKDKEKNVWVNEDKQVIPYEETFEIKDDVDDIIKCVLDTIDDVQWVFFGFLPPKLEHLARNKKIEFHPSVPILNYPSMLTNLQLQAIVAPITKDEFNFCKSHIKTMEAAVLGVPLFATNCLPYDRVMQPDQLFDTADELKEKILKLKFMSRGAYSSLIERQWKWFHTPCKEGSVVLKNYWLEDNLDIWINIFRLRQKGLNISFNAFKTQYENSIKSEEEKTLFTSQNNAKILI